MIYQLLLKILLHNKNESYVN